MAFFEIIIGVPTLIWHCENFPSMMILGPTIVKGIQIQEKYDVHREEAYMELKFTILSHNLPPIGRGKLEMKLPPNACGGIETRIYDATMSEASLTISNTLVECSIEMRLKPLPDSIKVEDSFGTQTIEIHKSRMIKPVPSDHERPFLYYKTDIPS